MDPLVALSDDSVHALQVGTFGTGKAQRKLASVMANQVDEEADLEKDNSTPHALKAKMRMIEKENQRLREENRILKTKAYKK